jgi:hypothetical protein
MQGLDRRSPGPPSFVGDRSKPGKLCGQTLFPLSPGVWNPDALALCRVRSHGWVDLMAAQARCMWYAIGQGQMSTCIFNTNIYAYVYMCVCVWGKSGQYCTRLMIDHGRLHIAHTIMRPRLVDGSSPPPLPSPSAVATHTASHVPPQIHMPSFEPPRVRLAGTGSASQLYDDRAIHLFRLPPSNRTRAACVTTTPPRASAGCPPQQKNSARTAHSTSPCISLRTICLSMFLAANPIGTRMAPRSGCPPDVIMLRVMILPRGASSSRVACDICKYKPVTSSL